MPKITQGSKVKDDGVRDSIHFIQTQAIHSSIQSIHLFIHSSIPLVIHSYTFIPPSLYSFIHSFIHIYSSVPPIIHTFPHTLFIPIHFIHPSHQSFIHLDTLYSSVPPVIHSYTLLFIRPSSHSFIQNLFIHPSIHTKPFIHSSIRPSVHSSITYLAQDSVAGDDDHNGEHSQAREHNKVGTENHRQELQSCTPE